MAYFSNGSEGMGAEEEFCSRCIHNDPEGPFCPVWRLHHDWNYAQCNENEVGEAKQHALDVLWPRNTKGENGDCSMFVTKEGGEDG